MHYDASPTLKSDVESRLRQDPRVIRWTTLKMGEKIEDVCTPNWSKTIRRCCTTRQMSEIWLTCYTKSKIHNISHQNPSSLLRRRSQHRGNHCTSSKYAVSTRSCQMFICHRWILQDIRCSEGCHFPPHWSRSYTKSCVHA
jgi:hypothetical protein